MVALVHNQMVTRMEDNTIQCGKRMLVPDVKEDNVLMHFCIHKVHVQEVADKLWSRL